MISKFIARLTYCIFALFAASACAHTDDGSVKSASSACHELNASAAYRIGNVICLKGEINQDLKDSFLGLSPKSGDVVVSSGPGGDIAAAMDIGDVIYKHDMLVIIDDLCGSSCAYFIALGGKRLAIYNTGLLGFHGGPIPESDIVAIPNLTDADRQKVIFDNLRFQRFFSQRGIDIRITNEVPQSLQNDGDDWKKSMWVRWPKELIEFGYKGLVFCSGQYCEKPAPPK